MVRGLAIERYSNFSCIRKDENGWSWIEVGHNASHAFYVGHDAQYDTFAIKSIGEEWSEEDGPDAIPHVEVYIHERSKHHTLAETLSGAYLGHF